MAETNKTKPAEKKRPGRPPKTPGGGKNCLIYLPIDLIPKLKALGGSRWVAEQLRQAGCPKSPKETTANHAFLQQRDQYETMRKRGPEND